VATAADRTDEDGLDDLRRLVVDDPLLRDRLVSTSDRGAFITEVIDVAQERGIELSAEQVVEGLRAARRRRLERWV
jgi:hypothetical protein